MNQPPLGGKVRCDRPQSWKAVAEHRKCSTTKVLFHRKCDAFKRAYNKVIAFADNMRYIIFADVLWFSRGFSFFIIAWACLKESRTCCTFCSCSTLIAWTMCKRISLPVIMYFTQYNEATDTGKTLLTMLISKIWLPGFEWSKYNFPVPISRLAGVRI